LGTNLGLEPSGWKQPPFFIRRGESILMQQKPPPIIEG
jgi:hypothetical protein